MIIQDYTQFGGRHAETASLKNVLAYLGVVDPKTGEPFTEELLFGIGGGIGFAYFLFEMRGSYPIYLGTRIHTKETERPEFLQTICSRLGIPNHVQNSSSANAAVSNLRRTLDQGRTPIAWVDETRLPYTGLLGNGNTYHTVVVYGYDEAADQVYLGDRCATPTRLSMQQFRHARESSWSPKYRAMLVERPEAVSDPVQAVEQGLRECLAQMQEGLGIANFGLKGMQKWATMLTSSKEKKAWSKIFPAGPALYQSLYTLFNQIETRSDGGAANRTLFADFLDQASRLLSLPALREAAEGFRESERFWADLADAHLPDSVDLFAETKRLCRERKVLYEREGAEAIERVTAIRDRLAEIAAQVAQEFPLDPNQVRQLMGDLRQRILKVYEHEAKCVEELKHQLEPMNVGNA